MVAIQEIGQINLVYHQKEGLLRLYHPVYKINYHQPS
jgi:hypothetical protein